MNVIGGFVYFFFLPETNQKTLEEIAEAFEGPAAKKGDLEAGVDTMGDLHDLKDTTAKLEEVEESKGAKILR